MSYLIRVVLPDEPGALGALAESFGLVDGNIQSVDIVESSPEGTVTDDIVVELPHEVMADVLVTAVNSLPGAEVDSIRPFSGRADRRGQIEMLADVARHCHEPSKGLERVVKDLPTAMTASWAIILDTTKPIVRLAASSAAPEDDGTNPATIDVTSPRVVVAESEDWVPQSWYVVDSALVAAPLTGTEWVIVVARVGGPDFLASEVDHLGNVADIIGSLLARSSKDQ